MTKQDQDLLTINGSADADMVSVFESMMASVDTDMSNAFLSIAGSDMANKAIRYAREGNCERYYFALPYPLSKVVRGLLNHAIPGKRDAQFILEHRNFLDAHFKTMIAEQEGICCCTDKARLVIRRLLRYYITGEEIVFDVDADHAFIIPTKIFTKHADIVEFFKALQALYYGNPKQYLAWLNSRDLTRLFE